VAPAYTGGAVRASVLPETRGRVPGGAGPAAAARGSSAAGAEVAEERQQVLDVGPAAAVVVGRAGPEGPEEREQVLHGRREVPVEVRRAGRGRVLLELVGPELHHGRAP